MSGLFGTLGNPAERSKGILRKALEARRDRWPHTGYLYRSGADLLLQHGTFFSGRELPDHSLKGTPNACFQNALERAEADATLRYFEGVYATGYGGFVPHAWCVDPAGNLLEVTMPTDPATVALGTDIVTGMKLMPVETWAYWGVEFATAFVPAYWEKHQPGNVGILDRPSHDEVKEWREEWPILRMAYDPKRTEP